MGEPEISDEELERQMRRKLLLNGPSSRATGTTLSDEEKRIAAKLLGNSEAERLQKRRPDSRPFRPKPPVVTAEYYELPGDQFSHGGWKVDIRENGTLRNSRAGLTRYECVQLLAKLVARGVRSKPVETEWMKFNKSPPLASPHRKTVRTQTARPTSKRKSFSERFGGFEP